MFNANVFSVLALHIKSKMIIFTSELLQVSDFFSGKFCIQLCFCLENGWKSGKEMGLMISKFRLHWVRKEQNCFLEIWKSKYVLGSHP